MIELVDEADLVVGAHRSALGGADDLVGVVETGEVQQPFGHPEDLLQCRAQDRLHFPCNFVRQPGAANLEDFEAGQLIAAGFLLVLDPSLGDGRDRG